VSVVVSKVSLITSYVMTAVAATSVMTAVYYANRPKPKPGETRVVTHTVNRDRNNVIVFCGQWKKTTIVKGEGQQVVNCDEVKTVG
jgi:hypothetical protein